MYYMIKLLCITKYTKYSQLKLPLSTIRARMKTFEKHRRVNLPRGGCMSQLPPRAVRRMVREAKRNPKITVSELHSLAESWGFQISQSTLRRLVWPAAFYKSFTKEQATKCSSWSVQNVTGTKKELTWCGQIRQNGTFWSWTLSSHLVEKAMAYNEKQMIPTVKYGEIGRASCRERVSSPV